MGPRACSIISVCCQFQECVACAGVVGLCDLGMMCRIPNGAAITPSRPATVFVVFAAFVCMLVASN